MLGKLLAGRYQVVQLLGTGGFCQTYLAQDTHIFDQPICVVKHLKPPSNGPNSLQTLRWLFTGEAQALKKLGSHDQIPQLLSYFEEDQEFYLVQEFIAGCPLSVEMQLGHRWSEGQVVQLLQDVLSILDFIHSHGLIHRDVKPSNIIRRQQDNRLVLIDFGSVKQAWTQVITLQGQKVNTFAIGLPATVVIGTPGYMPIEQERGKPRPNSDLYALGMIGIQALTGVSPTQIPGDPDTCEPLWQERARPSENLSNILNKMVCYHFKDRYQSATEALQALQPLTKLYPPKQPTDAPWRSQSAVPPAPVADSELDTMTQDTIAAACDDRTTLSVSDRVREPVPTPTRKPKSALLIDMGIGIAAAIAIMVGIYYSTRTPDPTPKIQKYPVSIPLKNQD